MLLMFTLHHQRAGGIIKDESSPDLIPVPPLSVPIRQRLVEKLITEGDGETKRTSQLQGELFAVSATTNDASLDLVCFDVLTITDSASAGENTMFEFNFSIIQTILHSCWSSTRILPVPTRLEWAKVDPPKPEALPAATDVASMPPSKRRRTSNNESEENMKSQHRTLDEIERATLWLDTLLRQ